MNVNIDFRAGSFANEMLRTMGDYVVGQSEGGNHGRLAELVANGRVRLIANGVEQTGKNGWLGRSDADKQLNDDMRSAFVKALANELGLKETSGALFARLDALFGRDVFKSGDYGKGRPLTMRRITAVLNKVDEAKQQLLTERVSEAFERLEESAPRLQEMVQAALEKPELGIGRRVSEAVLAQVSKFVEKARVGTATTFDLEDICFAALSSLKMPAGVKKEDEVKALTEKLRAALGGPDGRFAKLAERIKRDATLCLTGRARFRGEYFAQRFPRMDVEALIKRFSAVLGNDAQKCRRYALIRLLIDEEIGQKGISAKFVQSYTCRRLRELGVTDEEARQLWNVDDLKMRTAQKADASALTAVQVHQLIDGDLAHGLSLLLDVSETSTSLGRFVSRLKAECPTFGGQLSAYGENVKALVRGLTNLGATLLKRVAAERPNLTTAQKLAAVGRMLQVVKAEVSAQMVKGEVDLEQAIRRAVVPSAEELAKPTVEEQMSAFKALLLKYRRSFSDEAGNANNANGFQSRARTKMDAILGTLKKIVKMSAVKDDVIAKLEEAKTLVNGDYKKPCNATAPGREAVVMIQDAMGAGAHGDINAAGEMAFAVEMFCEVPELLCRALEEDARNGDDACFRELCEALNTDGCVQAYAKTVAVVHDKFNGFEAGLDLGSTDVHYTVEVLVGKAFAAVFPTVSAEKPISFDDFAERFARFLADHNRGSYEDRLAEIREKKGVLLSFLGDAGVVDRPILTKTTLFNKVFADPERQTGEVAHVNGDFIWKGLVFRAQTTPFSVVRERGRKAAQPVDGFSSRNDLSVPANLQEAKGLGKGLGATGQSGVSCCRTVKQCIGYATVRKVGQGCYVYVIDTTKMGANEKAWDMDSVYDAHGGENPAKTGAEVNASSIRKEAVMGWIKVPAQIAGIDKGVNGKSIEETKLQKLKFYVEQHPEAIELNPDFVASNAEPGVLA